MRSFTSGVQIPTSGRLNIDGQLTLSSGSGSSGQYLISGGSGATPTWTSTLSSSTLTSTVASGTAPLTVTSPTVVSNLASTYAIRGGIQGTTAPTTASTSNTCRIYVSATAPTDMSTGDIWISF